MAFTEDLDAFTDTDDFAVSATFHRSGGGDVTVSGIFDNDYQEVTDGDVEIHAHIITFGLKTAAIPAPSDGDSLSVEGNSYDIVNHRPDGTGWTILDLAEQ